MLFLLSPQMNPPHACLMNRRAHYWSGRVLISREQSHQPHANRIKMSISIDSKTLASSKLPSTTLHALPCTISHDGPARVSTFFIVRNEAKLEVGEVPGWVEKKDGHGPEANFRGRVLKGTKCVIPDGYQGLYQYYLLHVACTRRGFYPGGTLKLARCGGTKGDAFWTRG